jgi:GR25 family glycosyltransferase involved in LPS biosynthesis
MKNLPALFGATYLINLPERDDRLKSAERQLARVGWKIGSDGVRVFPALKFRDQAGFPSASIRGCFHSHLECLRDANAKHHRTVLILEDDIALTTSLPRLTTAIQSWLADHSWDFIYFGHHETGNISTANRKTDVNELSFIEWTTDLLTAHFYAINGRILPHLIAHLDKLSRGRRGDQEAGPMPVDGAYNIFRRQNAHLRCYIARPKLGWQMPSRSDITPRALDKFIFLRPLTNLVRRSKRIVNLWHA